MTAVYNENDPAACNVLRELIANNLIAPGDVDERSIKDVRADDYRGYDQWHFFSGAGMWSGALRRSGWPDARPVITGSCPCQPFSGAGKGLGFDDPRHLWPDWLRLIDEARKQGFPGADVLFGEQVDKANLWVDLVQLDLEARGFAFASPDLPAAGFTQGAHIRQRFYWVADRHNAERWSDLAGRHFGDWPQTGRIEGYGQSGAGLATGGLADGTGGNASPERQQRGGKHRQQPPHNSPVRLDDTLRVRWSEDGCDVADHSEAHGRGAKLVLSNAGAPDLFGSATDWLLCRDGNYRPVEAGTFPLVDACPGRVGALRIYGNGLDFETAVNFIGAYMEACEIAAVMSEYT